MSRVVQDSSLSALERKPSSPLVSRKLTSGRITLTVTVVKLVETDVENSPKPPARNDSSKIVQSNFDIAQGSTMKSE